MNPKEGGAVVASPSGGYKFNAMIDFLSTSITFDGKSSLSTAYLQEEATYSTGWIKFSLQGCEKIEVWCNHDLQRLRLQGSIPYYWQGHNFKFDKKNFVEAIRYIASLLRVDLWQSEINAFEFGVIMEVSMKPTEYIKHHSSEPKERLLLNEKPKDKGRYRWWEDKNVCLKMYDASANILMKQGMNRREIIREAGWSGENYLKWEAHYLRPEFLNNGVGLRLFQLANPEWSNVFKEDLYMQYQRLIPMKSIVTPMDKKDLSTADILMQAMAEEGINDGRSIEELKKILYARINSIPDNVLTKSDKDFRKKQVKKLLSNIRQEPESIYDLSQRIQDAINAEE